MESAEKVALLALAYSELGARADSKDDATSLLVKMVSGDLLGDPLIELDQLIVDAMGMYDEMCELIVELAWFSPLRYEALLHAWPFAPDPPPEGLPWEPYRGRRWDEVEEAMQHFRALGITRSRSDVNAIFEEAHAQALAAQN